MAVVVVFLMVVVVVAAKAKEAIQREFAESQGAGVNERRTISRWAREGRSRTSQHEQGFKSRDKSLGREYMFVRSCSWFCFEAGGPGYLF